MKSGRPSYSLGLPSAGVDSPEDILITIPRRTSKYQHFYEKLYAKHEI